MGKIESLGFVAWVELSQLDGAAAHALALQKLGGKKGGDARAKNLTAQDRRAIAGASQPRGAALNAQIQNLDRKLAPSGSLKDAAALVGARRAAR
jgi:hypothetical protein